MTSKLTIDKAGRIVLPKPVRDELELAPGDSLQLESTEEQITLRPVREGASMRKKQGVWVFSGGEPLPDAVLQKTIRKVRREREEQVAGKKL